MVTAAGVLRRSSTAPTFLDSSGGSSGESSRRPSAVVDVPPAPRRPSLANLSLRLSRSSKRWNSSKAIDTCPEDSTLVPTHPCGDCEGGSLLTGYNRRNLGQVLFSLPDEITVQIFCYLSEFDIFALRLTSRSVCSYLQTHAGPISRALLRQCAYEHSSDCEKSSWEKTEYSYNYIQKLYPQPQPCASIHYLLQMLRRQSQVDKMLSVIANFVQMKIYMIPSCPRFENFNPYKLRLMKRLHLAAWTMYHFLDKFRKMLILDHPTHSPDTNPQNEGESTPCRSCNEFVKELLPNYGIEIIPAYSFYDLSRQHLRSLSRAPSYAGSIERRLRGWSRKPPTETDLMQFTVFGGVPELCKLSMLKGTYNQRIEMIGSFVDQVSSAAIQTRLAAGANRTASCPTHPLDSSLPTDGSPSSSSFHNLTDPLLPPLSSISHAVISGLPQLSQFIVDSDEWIIRMFELVGPEDQILTAFGFVQNILVGKAERLGVTEDEDRPDDRLDFLAPVLGFDM